MNKLIKITSFFKPFVWMVGGFLLVAQGVEVVSRLDGISVYIVSIAIIFMSIGIVGKMLEDAGVEE